MPGPAVSVEDLVVRYGPMVAVDGVSFTAEAGRVTALLGPNGAGKTTTVETAEGHRRPDEGRVRVLGLDPVADRAQVVRRVGVMPQEGGVYPGLRAEEAVRLFAAYHERPLDPVALLERVGIADRARSTWRSMSGGEQQRLSLALALVGQPEVAFLDEPTAGVDVGGRQIVRQVVRDLRDDGVAVVLTTHELEEAERLADHVVIVDRGRVVAAGTPGDLVRRGGEEIRFRTAPGLDTAALSAHLGQPVTEQAPGEYAAVGTPDAATVAALTAWLAARDLVVSDLRTTRSLEDVFLRLTGGDVS
jgi:ABC-2 type transport system ATP-binding protein